MEDERPSGRSEAAGETDRAVLEARHLAKDYVIRRRGRAALARRDKPVVRAVDDVTLVLERRKVVAVVGESGSGKSTLARLLARLERPTRGEVILDGTAVAGRGARALRPFRRQVQVIFQDPFSSLNPVHTVGYHLERPLRVHRLASRPAEASDTVERLLARVSLAPASQFTEKYPHELSGGQRQRAAIARALAVQPSVLLADEPVSMLDVSIRMGILDLLASLGLDEDLAILYITHDISSARYFADSVFVMYAGQLIEGGTADQVTQEPAHPYTRLLIDSAPDPQRSARLTNRATTPTPDLALPTVGCRFSHRCPYAMDVCKAERPPQFRLGNGHWASCWLYSAEPRVVTVPVASPCTQASTEGPTSGVTAARPRTPAAPVWPQSPAPPDPTPSPERAVATTPERWQDDENTGPQPA